MNVAANALGKISLLDNQPEQTVTESEFLKTTAGGHRGVRLVHHTRHAYLTVLQFLPMNFLNNVLVLYLKVYFLPVTYLYRDNLEARLRNLQYVRTVWSKGDLKQALEVAIGLNEQGITVDILQVHTVLRVLYPFSSY